MKKITKEYEVYSYDELLPVAKDKAVSDYIQFLMDVIPYEQLDGNLKKAVDKAEDMKTPWFTASYVWEYCKDEIIEGCKQYEYLNDGSIFN